MKKAPPDRDTAQVFDLMIKDILEKSSARAKVCFINGLFGKSYPPDSAVRLAPSESVKKKGRKLARSQSDSVLEIREQEAPRGDAFLLEFQIDDDGTMVLRVFEYGLAYAQRRREISADGSTRVQV